jgi:1-acyl-sn-glycerol-3-phosphate acyltransferase
VALLRWLIQFLDAIPIDRDGMGLAGIRESLRRIRRGEMVLIFPEGTRTYDGDVAPLKSGFCVLARRGKASLLPVGIDGAFDAWPRTVMLPRPSQIRVCVGEPISPAWIKEASDEELVAELEQRIRKCHQQARKARKTPEKR